MNRAKRSNRSNDIRTTRLCRPARHIALLVLLISVPAAGKKSDPAAAVPSLDAPEPQAAAPEDATPTKVEPPKPQDDAVKSECGSESGRPFFLLTGRQGHLKGWVLHPADAAVKVGDPVRIHTRSKNARIWVLMFTGAGKFPTAEIAGSGMQTSLTVMGRKVFFGADKERVQCVP